MKEDTRVSIEDPNGEQEVLDLMANHQRLTDFMAEFKELIQKHGINFVNRDAYDSEEKYSHTDVFLTIDGQVWYGDTFHEILGEILYQVQDEDQGRC